MAEKVLVIDDEPAVLDVVADSLREAGYEPDTCTDSVTAAELISAVDYDLIVSDIVMPGLSGLEVLSLIKAHSPFTEVIMLTGFASRARAQEALEHGACAFLEKPFDMAELIVRAKQALWKRRVARESRTL